MCIRQMGKKLLDLQPDYTPSLIDASHGSPLTHQGPTRTLPPSVLPSSSRTNCQTDLKTFARPPSLMGGPVSALGICCIHRRQGQRCGPISVERWQWFPSYREWLSKRGWPTNQGQHRLPGAGNWWHALMACMHFMVLAYRWTPASLSVSPNASRYFSLGLSFRASTMM